MLVAVTLSRVRSVGQWVRGIYLMSEIARRSFLKAAAAFAVAGAIPGCGVFRNARGSALLASLPHRDDYLPVLHSLFETLLPFEDPRFAGLTRGQVERRLLEYFPLGDASEYGSLRRALVYFNDLRLVPHSAAPILDAERDLLDSRGVAQVDSEVARRVEEDRRAANGSPYSAPLFTELGPAERARYLSSWAASALIVKRRFYRSTKSLVMISAFSLESSWRVMDYEGPLLGRET